MRPKLQVRVAALGGMLAVAGLTAAGTSPSYALLSANGAPAEQAADQATRERPAKPAGTTQTTGDEATTTQVTPPPCPADVKNHGQYVSSVAKLAREDREPGRPEDPGAHGALVSAAARSDCGKDAGEESGTEATTESTDESTADSAKPGKGTKTRPGHAGKPASPGRSGERSRAAR